MSQADLNPPQAPPNWSHSPEALSNEVKAAISSTKQSYDAVAALKPSECTFNSVFVALAHAETALEGATEPLFFYQNVATSSKLRDAASSAEVMIRAFKIDSEMRLDLYQAMLHAKGHIDASNEKLSVEDGRLAEKMLLEGKRAGLALPEAERSILSEVSVWCNKRWKSLV
jgi:Zn-dependent oligopeptidase